MKKQMDRIKRMFQLHQHFERPLDHRIEVTRTSLLCRVFLSKKTRHRKHNCEVNRSDQLMTFLVRKGTDYRDSGSLATSPPEHQMQLPSLPTRAPLNMKKSFGVRKVSTKSLMESIAGRASIIPNRKTFFGQVYNKPINLTPPNQP